MESSKLNPHPLIPPSYPPPPPQPQPQPQPYPQLQPLPRPQNYIVLPLSFNLPNWDPPLRKRICKTIFLFIIITTVLLLLWPWNPDVTIVRLKFHHVRVHRHGIHIYVDISLDATVRVKNKAFYSMDYSTLDMAVAYREKDLGT